MTRIIGLVFEVELSDDSVSDFISGTTFFANQTQKTQLSLMDNPSFHCESGKPKMQALFVLAAG